MKKSKILLAITLLVGMPLLMYGLTLTMEKRYTAQVRLQVVSTGQRADYPDPFAPINEMQQRGRPGTTATQIQVMTGTEVLGAALQRARDNMPDKLASDENASIAYEGLVRRLQVDSDPLSDVVGLRVIQTNPELAAELANDIAYAYQDYMERQAKVNGQSFITALSSQVESMKKRLVAIDTRVATLKSAAKVGDPVAAVQSYTAAAASTSQSLDVARSQYEGAAAELSEAKRLLAGMPKTLVSSTSTQANPVSLGLETDLSRLRTQLADLQAKYTDSHPDVRSMKEQIRKGEASLAKYDKNIPAGNIVGLNPAYQTQLSNVAGLQGRANNLRNVLTSLESSSNGMQNKVNELPNLQRDIDGLNRERSALETSYAQIRTRLDAAQAAADSRQPSVQIVSPALVPVSPSFPDARLFSLVGLALGGFLSILILMPRQESSIPSDYYPAVYAAAPGPEPERAREPASAVATGDSLGLEGGPRRDP